MHKKAFLLLAAAAMALGTVSLTACPKNKIDEYTKDGKLKISVKNLYFDAYRGGDAYLEEIENDFKVKFTLDTYDWANWTTQVNSEINGSTMDDIFHANIDSYNFANTYKYWADEEMIKPLPDDLSEWPELKKVIDNTTNIDALKLNGKLYGIPIAKDTTDYSTTFSPFTYVYRRDWAKKLGVYQENDEYTWEQFTTLLEAFKNYLNGRGYALGDVEWGYPSLSNFYKQVPHCFAQDASGKYINNYTTQAYIDSMNEAKRFRSNGWYYPDQHSAADGDLNKKYWQNQIGVFFENLSYTNYVNLKAAIRKTNVSVANFNVDDAMAIMKIRGTDGKYALEGTDNWFSMTFFDNRISDNKQRKMLDILDYLLSKEGTLFSVYGFEGYDWVMDGETPKIVPEYWPKDEHGDYSPKNNGGRYLRYLVSLGYDLLPQDPLTDQDSIEYLNAWDAEMRTALANGELKVLKENKEVMWLTTENKALYSGGMRDDALKNVAKYIHNDLNESQFRGKFGKLWDTVLDEINEALGK